MKTPLFFIPFLLCLVALLASGPEARAATISGTVTEDAEATDVDEAAPGVEGTQVSLLLLPGEEEVAKVTVDEFGNFDFGDLPPGDYVLVIQYASGLIVTTTPFAMGGTNLVYTIPVVTTATLPRFTNLSIVNPTETRAPEASPFAP